MEAKETEFAQRNVYFALVVLVSASLLIGGGGVRFPIFEMLIQLIALSVVFLSAISINSDQWQAIRFPACLLLTATVLALLQLLPLPPNLWINLPGRETYVEIASEIGRAAEWRPLSLDPELTLRSALSIIVPISVLMGCACINRMQRENLLYLVLAMSLVHMLVALAQAGSGGESFYLFSTSHEGLPIGLFANRNHTAQLFLMCIFVTAAVTLTRQNNARPEPVRLMGSGGLMLLFAFAIIATNSRTVSLLLIAAALLVGAQLLWQSLSGKRGFFVGSIIVASLIGSVTAIFLGEFATTSTLLERFNSIEDHRFEFWPTAIDTMVAFFPFGSGFGTFDISFRANEPLETVGTHFVNAAHNDFIELAIETGIFGPLLLFLGISWVAVRLARGGWRNPMARNGAFALLCLLLHSLTDYPIRTYGILVTATLMAAVLAHEAKPS